MLGPVLNAYRLNLEYARRLVADVPDEVLAAPAGPGLENHPAFTLGHLCVGSARLGERLGDACPLPEGWRDLFDRNGPSDTRRPAIGVDEYPTGATLVAELARQHDHVDRAARALDPSRLEERVEWHLAAILPTLADLITFMCVSHEAIHLGQIAAWRRGRGFPPALA